jgi:hypothetical protein
MKTKTAIGSAVFFMFALWACTPTQPSSSEPTEPTTTVGATSMLTGTWKLITYQYGNQPKLTLPEEYQWIKLITPTHFTWVHYTTNNKVVSSSAGGTYSFDGETYVETIDFGGMGMQRYFDKQHTFKVTFEENKMYQSGYLAYSLHIKEVWEKVEL